MFNARLRKYAIENYNAAVERYKSTANDLNTNARLLYDERQEALNLIRVVEERINQLANTPKTFDGSIQKINVEVENFKGKQQEIQKAELEAKAAAGGSGTGAALSALGVAVATMGPTAAMGIATTFGVASTGTAISALSGAAATNAALAWLGGGALTVGGGGMSAGAALLALAGPVGWTIAGVALAGSIGSGLYAVNKNKKTADKFIVERQNIEKAIQKFNSMNADINALTEVTQKQIAGVNNAVNSVKGCDYSKFSDDEKLQVGMLINSTLSLAQLVNKELTIDE